MSAEPGGEFPPLIAPMLAVAARIVPRDEENYAAEFKWDGMRGILYLSGGRLQVRSRSGRDVTSNFPELGAIAGAAAGDMKAVMDGEIVALDENGLPSFAALLRRMHVSRPGTRLLSAVPVTFMAFDLLQSGSRLLPRSPYEERRALLQEAALPAGVSVVPPAFPGDAAAVLHAARELGLEGVVLKRLGSRYEPGRRSRAWLKIKNLRNLGRTQGSRARS